MQQLLGDAPDPFALYHAPLHAARLWRRTSAALLALVGVLAFALALVTMRPPTVIVYDRAAPDSLRVVSRHEMVSATAADARLFFGHMLTLRYGWDSLTVKRDLTEYLSACFGPARSREAQYLQAKVAREADGSDRSRIVSYMQQGIANALRLPDDLGQIDCRRRGERRQWDCYVQADLVTTPLLSIDAAAGTAAVQRLQFVGSLLEVPRTGLTPYGLVLAALHSEQAPAAAGLAAAANAGSGQPRPATPGHTLMGSKDAPR